AARFAAERTGGDMFDVVIDATGNATAIEASFDFVAHGGTLTLLSVVKDRISFADPDFHRREMRLVGSRNALAEDFADVLAAIAAGQVPTAAMLTHRSKLVEVPGVFAEWLAPQTGVIKAMIEL
ncbi:MAG: dehydrogenase, partial [Rhodospirillales bacterium 20-64-7]